MVDRTLKSNYYYLSAFRKENEEGAGEPAGQVSIRIKWCTRHVSDAMISVYFNHGSALDWVP